MGNHTTLQKDKVWNRGVSHGGLSGPEVDRPLRRRFGALLLIEHVEGLSAAEALGEGVQSVVLVIAVCALHVSSVILSGIYGGLKVSALLIAGRFGSSEGGLMAGIFIPVNPSR